MRDIIIGLNRLSKIASEENAYFEKLAINTYNQLLEKLVYVPRDVLKCISPKKGRP